ncbi:MAG: SOS response-associated peptidase family protein [Clostridia bacterium]|nr:SOS response-associated peptidase family protein [Clostridia bacterium]
MCGRYYIDEAALRGYESADWASLGLEGGMDVCPGMDAPVLIMAASETAFCQMRWGFDRPEGGLVINARVETMTERTMFRSLSERRRCAIPASRYYEWRRADHQKFEVAFNGADRFWLAGLYRMGRERQEFVVLTQPPVPAIQVIHNRMPLILPTTEAVERWLRGETPLFENNGAVRVAAEGPEQLQMRF